jgi:hypothetical protein
MKVPSNIQYTFRTKTEEDARKIQSEFALTFNDESWNYTGSGGELVSPLVFKINCCRGLIQEYVQSHRDVTHVCIYYGNWTLIIFNGARPFCHRVSFTLKQAQQLISVLIKKKIARNEVCAYDQGAFILEVIR